MRRGGAVRSREPVELVRFSGWVCRTMLVLVVLSLAAAVADLAGAPTAAGPLLFLSFGLAVVAGLAVSARWWPEFQRSWRGEPLESREPGTGSRADTDISPSEPPAPPGWTTWSIPTRAQNRARAQELWKSGVLIKRLSARGPIAPEERARAGVLARQQVSQATAGTVQATMLLATALTQVDNGNLDGLLHGLAVVFLVGALGMFVVYYRLAAQWRGILHDPELTAPPPAG